MYYTITVGTASGQPNGLSSRQPAAIQTNDSYGIVAGIMVSGDYFGCNPDI